MRDIYICDAQGNTIEGSGYLGIPYEVWSATSKLVEEQEGFQVLGPLWRYYYGREGDALLSPDEVDLLLNDIQQLRQLLNNLAVSETEDRAIQTFFSSLSELCQRAIGAGHSLKFVAD